MDERCEDSLDELSLEAPFVHKRNRWGSTFLYYAVTTNGLIGTGFLSIGYTYRHGIFLSLIMNTVTCGLSYVGNMLLYWTAEQIGGFSHEEIWAAAYGRKTCFIPSAFLVLFDLACIAMYMSNIINGYKLVTGHEATVGASELTHNKIFVMFCVWAVGVLPMCFVNNIRHMVWPCLVAGVGALIIIVYSIYMFFGQLHYNNYVLDPAGQMMWFSRNDVLNMMQDFLFAYTYAPLQFTMMAEMREDEWKFRRLSRLAAFPLLTAFLSYEIVGLLCYFTLYDKLDGRMYPGHFIGETVDGFTGIEVIHTIVTVVMFIFMLMSIAVYLVPLGDTFARYARHDSAMQSCIAVSARIILSFSMTAVVVWVDTARSIADSCLNLCTIVLCYAFIPFVTIVFRGLENTGLFFVNILFVALAGLLTIFLFR